MDLQGLLSPKGRRKGQKKESSSKEDNPDPSPRAKRNIESKKKGRSLMKGVKRDKDRCVPFTSVLTSSPSPRSDSFGRSSSGILRTP